MNKMFFVFTTLFSFFAGSAEMFDRLDLGDRIMGDLQIHLRLLHGLQQSSLDPGARHIVADEIPR